jgi:hypothetical protein
MLLFLAWLLLFIICWPVALIALVLYPLVWLILLPFRLLGFAVGNILSLLWKATKLPMSLLKRGRRRSSGFYRATRAF